MNIGIIILTVVHILIAVFLIVVVLFQSGKQEGLGAIAGGAETFFGKNKGRTMDAMLGRLTSIGAVAFILTSVLLNLLINKA